MISKTNDPLNEFKFWNLVGPWSGLMFMSVFIIFWGVFCKNLPPIAAVSSPDTIAAYFRENATLIRIGLGICMTFTFLYINWGIVIGRVMSKIVGKDSVLIDVQVLGAVMTAVPVIISSGVWLSGGYRPELPATDLQQTLDISWMILDMCYATTTFQMIAMGIAFLSDKREKPLIPRWLAWFGMFVGVSFAAELLMPFFTVGAFARQGLLNFWIEFGLWFIWCPVLSVHLFPAIKRLKQEAIEAARM